MHTREPFEKAYKVYHVLGKGGFGIVYAGVRNHDGLQVAIKHIAKAKIKDWGQVSHFIWYLINIQQNLLEIQNMIKWNLIQDNFPDLLLQFQYA